MQPDKEENITGDRQSGFAGTNPNRYGAPLPEDEQNNDIDDSEAQNVIDGSERLSGEEADRARNKANVGIQQGRDD